MTSATAAYASAFDAPLVAPDSTYSVWYDVEPQERHRRLSVAFRAILAVPHVIVVALLGQVAYLVTLVGWLSIMFSGRYDAGLWGFVLMYVRWQARIMSYLTLLRDEYPPFGSGPYPVTFEIPFPERRSRLRTFFRALLILPHYVALYFIMVTWYAGVALAWCAILISGRYPEGVRRLVVGLNRWMLRLLSYVLLLRDEFPPFSLGLDELPLLPPRAAQPVPMPEPAWPQAPAWQPEPDPIAAYAPIFDRPPAVAPNSTPEDAEITSAFPALPPVEHAEVEDEHPVTGFFAPPRRPPAVPNVIEPAPDDQQFDEPGQP